MKRFLATTFLMAGTSLLPVLALHAQQPPPTAPASQPAAKAAEKTADDGVERPDRSHQGRGPASGRR